MLCSNNIELTAWLGNVCSMLPEWSVDRPEDSPFFNWLNRAISGLFIIAVNSSVFFAALAVLPQGHESESAVEAAAVWGNTCIFLWVVAAFVADIFWDDQIASPVFIQEYLSCLIRKNMNKSREVGATVPRVG